MLNIVMGFNSVMCKNDVSKKFKRRQTKIHRAMCITESCHNLIFLFLYLVIPVRERHVDPRYCPLVVRRDIGSIPHSAISNCVQ